MNLNAAQRESRALEYSGITDLNFRMSALHMPDRSYVTIVRSEAASPGDGFDGDTDYISLYHVWRDGTTSLFTMTTEYVPEIGLDLDGDPGDMPQWDENRRPNGMFESS